MTDAIDQAAITRGRKAQAELELTADILAGLRQAALEEIVVSSPDHTVKRERLIVCVQSLDALRSALEQAVRDGETAATYRNLLAEQNLLRP